MRISDWSSDVCSSDLNIAGGFDASSFPGINFENYLDYINSTYGPSVRVPEPNNTYNLKEKVFAGYVQADFEAGPLRGNIGVRVAHTKQSGLTSDRLQFLNDYCVDGPGGQLGRAHV